MANNRELSQLASFVTVNDTSKTIAFGSTVASLNVAGVVTATSFDGHINAVNVNVSGVGTITKLEATNINVSSASTIGIVTALPFQVANGCNVTIGPEALSRYGGFHNVAIGRSAGQTAGNNGANNVYIGKEAGCDGTTGFNNVFLGKYTGRNNTFGKHNVAVGDGAYSGETTRNIEGIAGTDACWQIAIGAAAGGNAGTGNINIGKRTGLGNTSGNYNNFIGWYTGCCNKGGCFNVAMGMCAGTWLHNTKDNIFLGRKAGAGTTSMGLTLPVDGNVFIGYNAGLAVTNNASHNVAIGYSVGCSMTTGKCNIFIGYGVGQDFTGGAGAGGAAFNIWMGDRAGQNVGVATGNLYFGEFAGASRFQLGVASTETQGKDNAAFGRCAMSSLGRIGDCNTAIGPSAGTRLDYGSGCNVFIGRFAGACGEGSHNNIAIGCQAGFRGVGVGTYSGCHNIFIGRAAGAVNQTGCGNIAIGCAADPSTSGTDNEATLRVGSTSARFASGDSSWTFTSDARCKENIEDLGLGLGFLQGVTPRKYTWKESGCAGAGFVAQELNEVVTQHDAEALNLVSTANPDEWTVASSQLVPVLVNAVKELSARVTELEARLDAQ